MMTTETPFIVIVRFQAQPGQQDQALAEIGDYVDGFLRHQNGFLGSELLRGDSEGAIVHIARWRGEVDFKAFATQAQTHPDLPKLRRYAPAASFHRVWKRYQPPTG